MSITSDGIVNGLPCIRNGQVVPIQDVPILAIAEFREAVISSVEAGARINALFAKPSQNNLFRIVAVLANDSMGTLSILFSEKIGDAYQSLTPECPQAHGFEREIAEQSRIIPQGHPWLKPIRFASTNGLEHPTKNPPIEQRALPGMTDYFQVQGEEVHEVGVGPVHAGIIEPGHFRFQCHGEHVFHLEISLGYQHRGIERALVGGPGKRTIHFMETLAGDTTIGHTTAYCEIVESLTECKVGVRAQILRSLALELERLANHVGDLGALASDVGFLPTASYCGRIRGDFLNMTAVLCGSRFGRSFMRPGGVQFDLEPRHITDLSNRLSKALHDAKTAIDLLWDSSSVMARFESTGTVTRTVCEDLGLVGLPARATGLPRDVRHAFPSGSYRFFHIPLCTWDTGDVFARAYVRWLEIQHSVQFVQELLKALPAGPVGTAVEVDSLAPNAIVVSLVEGWRGEICHVAITDPQGKFERYKIVDPSFHNWMGLALALRGQQISDFPLCNKSFNLSYCGHDL